MRKLLPVLLLSSAPVIFKAWDAGKKSPQEIKHGQISLQLTPRNESLRSEQERKAKPEGKNPEENIHEAASVFRKELRRHFPFPFGPAQRGKVLLLQRGFGYQLFY